MGEEREPRYGISIAARLVGVRTHTLRYYERVGIIEPYRSQGKIRLYSDWDVARLRQAKTLMDDLGVNLAGVEVILNMRERMTEMRQQMNELFQQMLRRMESEFKDLEQAQEQAEGLVPVGRKGITRRVPIEEG